MRAGKLTVCILSTVFIALLISGCGKNPTAPKKTTTGQHATVNVQIADENANTLRGIHVTLYPQNSTRITDDEGMVIFSDIVPGQHSIVVEHPNIPLFFRDIELTRNQVLDLKFVVASQITITVVVTDLEGQPLKDLVIGTYPSTMQIITNENGLAVFENIPVQSYKFLVSRSTYTVYTANQKIIITNGELQDIKIRIGPQPPFVKITSPENRHYQNIFNIHLVCDGYDFEDGELPDEALFWHSNIDGDLGYGKELFVDRLSVGHHTITLNGIDSDLNVAERSIELNLYYFEKDSYFPIPWNAWWDYRYLTPEFTSTGLDGRTETWKLKDLEVSMDDVHTRNCLMKYTITRSGRNKVCEYYVVDHFETDMTNIYVEKTIEELKVWDNTSVINDPTDQIVIETVYSPRYVFLKNHLDPASESSYETTVTGDVTWWYTGEKYGSKEFRETINFTTRTDIEGYETVESDVGTFDAVKFTITQGDAVRRWWLTEGFGMVRLEFDTLGSPQIATLNDTNIHTLSENGAAEKYQPGTAFRHTGGEPLHKLFTTEDHTPERYLEMVELLREFCPR